MAHSAERTRHQGTFAVLAVAVGAFGLLQSLIVPMLSTLQHDLHTTQDTITWVLTAYLLSASIFTPIMGRIGDMVGKKRVLVVTLFALALGSLLAAIATSVQIMIVARGIQGVGGGVLPLAFGIIRDEFPTAKIPGAVGAIASLAALGSGFGFVIAGPIVDALDYHWLFWLPMIVTIVAAGAAHLSVPESPVRSAGRISWLPAVLLSIWLVALMLAFSEGPTWGWGSAKVIGLTVVAITFAIGWIVSEQRAITPLIDMGMMRLRGVWPNNLVALLVGTGMFAVFAFVPEFVQTPRSRGYGFGASITESGLILLPSTAASLAVGMNAWRWASRFGAKALVICGCLVGMASLLTLAFAHGSRWELYVALGVQGAGFGMVFSPMSSLIVSAVPAEQTGVASGMNANIRTIGGSIGAAVMASIVTSSLRPDGLPKQIGYTVGFTALAGALLMAALAGLLIPSSGGGRAPAVVSDDRVHGAFAVVAVGPITADSRHGRSPPGISTSGQPIARERGSGPQEPDLGQ